MIKTTHHLKALILMLALLLAALLCGSEMTGASTAYAAAITELNLGVSTEGRPITAVRFGDGALKLVVVGDTHGGPEANTYYLTTQLIAYFRAHPEQVPASVRLYFIPTLNPDGLANGSRFNGNGVDLNRNMNTDLDDCAENDWRISVQGAYGVVSDTGGPYAESEVESRLIRDFLLDASGAIFLHSNAGLVFPAFCESEPSIKLGEVYAGAAGYVYSRYWPNYLITGGMHDWAGSLGIAAITPELVTGTDSEFDQNLAGLGAVLAQVDTMLLQPQDQVLNDINVPALIWRYWKSHGGEEAFGMPLEGAQIGSGIASQAFSRATLLVAMDRADTPGLVQPAPLGQLLSSGTRFAPGDPASAPRFFAETGHTLRESFLDYWLRTSGDEVLGMPISEEFDTNTVDGRRRIVQFFERGELAYYPEHAGTPAAVQPEPLGYVALQRAQVLAPWIGAQVR